jgi:hypothetical protein
MSPSEGRLFSPIQLLIHLSVSSLTLPLLVLLLRLASLARVALQPPVLIAPFQWQQQLLPLSLLPDWVIRRVWQWLRGSPQQLLLLLAADGRSLLLLSQLLPVHFLLLLGWLRPLKLLLLAWLLLGLP